MSENLTADEAEQYDRQIRLWGLDAQKRLRRSRVLVIGVGGLGAEVSKNIVLAGVCEITLMDHINLKQDERANRFLMQTEGLNRAEQAVKWLRPLNPNVSVVADTEQPEEKSDEYFYKFDVVLATCCSTAQLVRLNELCHTKKVKFFCGDVWGYYGYFFTDLGEHEYVMEVKKDVKEDVFDVEGPMHRRRTQQAQVEMVTVKQIASFCSLKEALATDWTAKPASYFRRTPPTFFIIRSLQEFQEKEGRTPNSQDTEKLEQIRQKVADKLKVSPNLIPVDYARWCSSELSPVCAIVGGVLGQEVIKAISAKDSPYKNCFLFDGRKSTGIVECVG